VLIYTQQQAGGIACKHNNKTPCIAWLTILFKKQPQNCHANAKPHAKCNAYSRLLTVMPNTPSHAPTVKQNQTVRRKPKTAAHRQTNDNKSMHAPFRPKHMSSVINSQTVCEVVRHGQQLLRWFPEPHKPLVPKEQRLRHTEASMTRVFQPVTYPTDMGTAGVPMGLPM